jgi:hypothetical protein
MDCRNGTDEAKSVKVEQGGERDSPPSFHMPRFRIPIIDIIFRSIRKFTKPLSIPDISVVHLWIEARERS